MVAVLRNEKHRIWREFASEVGVREREMGQLQGSVNSIS